MSRWRIGGLARVVAASLCVCGPAWAQAERIDAEGRLVVHPDASLFEARAMALYMDDHDDPSTGSVLFDERDEASGVRVIALVSPARQPSPSEFYLRVGVWGDDDGPRFATAPTLHLIAPDDSVELRGVWRIGAYDRPGGEPTGLPEAAADDVLNAGAPPRRLTVDAGPVRPGGGSRFVRNDAGAADATGSALARAIEWENYYDTYAIPGTGDHPAAGYEYVVPLHVTDGRLMARAIVSGIDWEAEDGATRPSAESAAVAVDLDHDERAASRTRREAFAPAATDIIHAGVIIRINSDTVGRKPYMRVDAAIRYIPEVMQAEAARMERLRGPEGKALVAKGMLSAMPTAEEIEADQLAAIDRAEEAIRRVLVEAGFPAPVAVLFPSWVIQG